MNRDGDDGGQVLVRLAREAGLSADLITSLIADPRWAGPPAPARPGLAHPASEPPASSRKRRTRWRRRLSPPDHHPPKNPEPPLPGRCTASPPPQPAAGGKRQDKGECTHARQSRAGEGAKSGRFVTAAVTARGGGNGVGTPFRRRVCDSGCDTRPAVTKTCTSGHGGAFESRESARQNGATGPFAACHTVTRPTQGGDCHARIWHAGAGVVAGRSF